MQWEIVLPFTPPCVWCKIGKWKTSRVDLHYGKVRGKSSVWWECSKKKVYSTESNDRPLLRLLLQYMFLFTMTYPTITWHTLHILIDGQDFIPPQFSICVCNLICASLGRKSYELLLGKRFMTVQCIHLHLNNARKCNHLIFCPIDLPPLLVGGWRITELQEFHPNYQVTAQIEERKGIVSNQ